jgi:peptidyl-prolyl cis-trans isomerase C
MFKASRTGLAAALLVSALSLPAHAEDKVLAKVDGQPITSADVDVVMTTMAQQLAQVPEDQRKRMAVNRLVDMRIIAAQATKDGLDKSDEFKRRMDALRQQILINEFVRVKVAGSISDDDLKKRYDAEVAKLTLGDEMRARHILVKTKDEAVAIIADLAKGGDFAKIAEEKSQDPGSAKQGGDLGYFAPGDMVKPFEDAAGALKPGEYTKTPIETQFGFHVIKLEDKRKQQPPAFDDVKEQLRQDAVGTAFTAKLDELKKAAKVEIDDAAVGGK